MGAKYVGKFDQILYQHILHCDWQGGDGEDAAALRRHHLLLLPGILQVRPAAWRSAGPPPGGL